MQRNNYLYTIERNGEKLTVVDAYSHPLIFLLIEKEFGHDTVILFSQIISKEEYDYYTQYNKTTVPKTKPRIDDKSIEIGKLEFAIEQLSIVDKKFSAGNWMVRENMNKLQEKLDILKPRVY